MRRSRLIFTCSLFCLFAITACKRDLEEIIDGNIAPPDPTVEKVVKENYINRVYISLLGRKPVAAEYSTAFDIVDAANLDSGSRAEVLDIVLSQPEFRDNQFTQAKADLLEGIDTVEIINQILLYELLKLDPQYAAYIDLLNAEIDKMNLVLDIPSELKAGAIDEREMHRRLVSNAIYDEINMGTQNFIISTFTHLLLRYPTASELEQSTLMVEGFNGVLFLETGKSKSDYLNIFTLSSDYCEGRVRDAFLRYVFREPQFNELTSLTQAYKANDDYRAILKSVLGSGEFAGL